jgi:anti-sigma B factor antagonist
MIAGLEPPPIGAPVVPITRTDGFRCDVEPDRDRAIVRPVGELDLATVGVVDARLLELRDAGFRNLLLDLTRLTFFDSSGIHLLLHWSRVAAQDGVTFAVAVGERARRPLELTGALELLVIVPGDGA